MTSTFATFDRKARCFYFRIRGYGICVEHKAAHEVLFSERNGYRRVYYVGPLVIEFLKP